MPHKNHSKHTPPPPALPDLRIRETPLPSPHPSGLGLKVELFDGDEPLSYLCYLEALSRSAAARELVLEQLRQVPFPAYFWEWPPLSLDRIQRPAEYVLILAPQLFRTEPEPHVFAEHFSTPDSVATFGNLSGDATLLAPAPADLSMPDSYAHLANFVRMASHIEQHTPLEALGATVLDRLGNQPLWISTSGLGVHWLHIRLEQAPKYYQYGPYRAAT